MKRFFMKGFVAGVLSIMVLGFPAMCEANQGRWIQIGSGPVWMVSTPQGTWSYFPPVWANIGVTPGWYFEASAAGNLPQGPPGNVPQAPRGNFQPAPMGGNGNLRQELQRQLVDLKIQEQGAQQQVELARRHLADWEEKQRRYELRGEYSPTTGMYTTNTLGRLLIEEARLESIRNRISEVLRRLASLPN